jgi:hypothetical protein
MNPLFHQASIELRNMKLLLATHLKKSPDFIAFLLNGGGS